MLNINYVIKLPVLMLVLPGIFMSGCTTLKTYPNAAHSLDTVVLAVGSADGMTRANTTAVYIPDSNPGAPYDLTPGIQSIFRLYGDKTSELYSATSNTSYITSTSGHEPWLTAAAINLPVLPVGTGVVRFTTTATYPTIGSHINNVDINLEILEGTGAPADLSYEFGVGATMNSDLTLLESQPLAQVIPEFPSSINWPDYGAIEMSLHVPTGSGANVRVVADDMNGSTRSGMNVMPSLRDSNQDMKVMFISPRGRMKYYEPRLALVLVDLNNGGPADFTTIPVVNSITYYDVDGNVVAGPVASTFAVDMR